MQQENMVVKKECHCRGLLSGMTPNWINTRAFTLMELLVVVLIIGILAAVAVPQYQKAIEKSKATQGITLLQSLVKAAEVYEQNTGTWPDSFEDLDISIPGGFQTVTPTTVIGYNSKDTRSNGIWELQLEKERASFNHDNIYIFHPTGPYQGAGFIYERTGVGHTALKKISCFESRPAGSDRPSDWGKYCEKIMKGKIEGRGRKRDTWEFQ